MVNVPQDSYVTVEWADSYHSIRPSFAVWQALSIEEKERLLVSASDYLDANYPLKDNLSSRMRNGKAAIPDCVKKAVCELCLFDGIDYQKTETAQKSSVKVGEIAVTYAVKDGLSQAQLNRENTIKGLLRGCGILSGSLTGEIPLLRG